jgi:hypothetical protein
MPQPAPYAGGQPLGRVVRQEIARRRRGVGVESGAACLEGLFLRFEGSTVLGARPWGRESGAWLLLVRRPDRWSSVEPWLDLRGLNLAAPRSVTPDAPPPREARDFYRYRQLRLAFPGDDVARAWNERACSLPDALLPVPDWAIDQAARLGPDRQWRILQFLNATRDRGRDLCQSNLPLAFLLASRASGARIRASEAVNWKQRRILGALGFPAQEAAVRVLRRIDDRALGSPLLANVRSWMRDPACLRRLAHVPRLGAAGRALHHAAELEWFDDRALPEVLGSDDPEILHALHGFTGLVRRLDELGYGPPDRVSSAAQIPARTEALRGRLSELQDLPAGRKLPNPPLPGIPGVIEPLSTVYDVILEGERMHHCVGAYVRAAAEQRVALYRVLRPQRATLSLVSRRRRWRIDELRLAANATPSWECYSSVEQWIRANTPPARRRRSAQWTLLPE